MTLSAWVKPSAVGSWQRVIFKTNGSQNLAYALYAFSDSANNTVRGYLTTGSMIELAGGSTLAAQTWTHLALSYDGTTMRLYVNGSQVAQQRVSGSMVATTGALELGGNTSYGTEWFAGLLDDVRVYNRALSASEIVADRDTAVAQATPTHNQRAMTRDQGSGGRGQATTEGVGSGDQGLGAAASAVRTISQSQNPKPHTPDPDSPIFTSFGKALLRQLQQSISTTTRTISYDDDGLQRLTSASENPGTTQTYSYDLAGNRTGVWVNGTRTQNYTYNAANQVTGWSYDAVGNLLSDGSQSYSYDALSRVLSVGSTTNQYNADGTLVAQTVGSITTRYTQDLAAPLSQILADGTQRSVSGSPAERLFAQQGSSARTW